MPLCMKWCRPCHSFRTPKRRLYVLLLRQNGQKKKIIQKVFSELYLSGNTLTYNAEKNGFKLLERGSVRLGAPGVWLSELIKGHFLVKTSLEEMHTLSSVL